MGILEPIKQRTKILIVDDEKEYRRISRLILQHAGYSRVDDTDDPLAAVRKIQAGTISLVLLDWHMPRFSGLDLLKSVRSFNTRIPILMMTSENDEKKVYQAIREGATDYILKPIKREILTAKVKLHLGESEE